MYLYSNGISTRHSYNPSIWEEDYKFKTSLGRIARPCLNKQNIKQSTQTEKGISGTQWIYFIWKDLQVKIQTSRLLSIVVLGYEWGLTDPKKWLCAPRIRNNFLFVGPPSQWLCYPGRSSAPQIFPLWFPAQQGEWTHAGWVGGWLHSLKWPTLNTLLITCFNYKIHILCSAQCCACICLLKLLTLTLGKKIEVPARCILLFRF
jgi:hypothetical protein